jgi:putative peptidoglycan lipid II flippase
MVKPGYAPEWGAFGLTASAGFAAWIEFLLLRRWLAQRIGAVPVPTKLGLGCLAAAIASGAAAYATNLAVDRLVPGHIAPRAVAAIAVFGLVYFAIATLAKIPEAHAFTGKITRRFR